MYNPKPEVYQALKALGYSCSQGSQAIFNEVPAITYSVGDNVPRYNLDKEIPASDIEIIVDIWANGSEELSRIVSEVEAAMRGIDYLLTYSADIPNTDDTLHHHQMRFGAVKT